MWIKDLNQILPKIQGKDEFVVIDKDDYIVIDYVFQGPFTFDSPEALECRGIKFNKDGSILARPFQKFFNHGERGHELDSTRPHTVLEKLDGSMIHSAMLNDQIVLMTRKGITDTAKQAWEAVTENHIRLFEDAAWNGVTPIFEYTSPNNRIVLPYSEPKLTLIGIRNTVTGEHCDPWSMIAWQAKYGVPLVDGFHTKDEMGDVYEFLAAVRDLEGNEVKCKLYRTA